MTVTCPECFRIITLTSTPQTPHFSLVCPHCQVRVTVTYQPRVGATERKSIPLCTEAGRFLAEYDPTTTTVTSPYRGKDYQFDLKRVAGLQSK